MTEAEATPERPARSAWAWWLGLACSVSIGVFLSALAYTEHLPEIVQRVDELDKVLHFALAGGITFFLDGVCKRRDLHAGALAVPLSSVIFLVPAAIEEYLQRFTRFRTSSVWDFSADVAGVLVFTWLSRRV